VSTPFSHVGCWQAVLGRNALQIFTCIACDARSYVGRQLLIRERNIKVTVARSGSAFVVPWLYHQTVPAINLRCSGFELA